ncbi:MAG: hypothetical protein JNM09_17810 [Blastocatellia bacterium]|nr:hypothetical protein [Blastocatellia bacterium]
MGGQTRTIHLAVGVLVIAVFLLTGYHMRFHIHHLMEANERLRFSLRGNHIYILLLGLLNLGLGAYLRISQTMWRAYVQLVGSLMILAATILTIIAFFFENKESLERPFSLMTMILALTGTVLHVISSIQKNPAN